MGNLLLKLQHCRAVSVAEFWCALPRKKVNLLCFFTKAHSGKSNVWHPKKLNSASGFWLFGECQIIEVGFSGHTVHWAGWHSSSSCSILNLMHVVTQANGFVEWLRFFPHFFSTSPSDSCWFNLKLAPTALRAWCSFQLQGLILRRYYV